MKEENMEPEADDEYDGRTRDLEGLRVTWEANKRDIKWAQGLLEVCEKAYSEAGCISQSIYVAHVIALVKATTVKLEQTIVERDLRPPPSSGPGRPDD